MKESDPAYWMLHDGFETVPTVRNVYCYICRDPEFAQMGLPLCYECLVCKAHVPADNCVCDNGHRQPTDPIEELMIRREYKLEITSEMFQRGVEMSGYLAVIKLYISLGDTSWMRVKR
jgi:hypothetical protein